MHFIFQGDFAVQSETAKENDFSLFECFACGNVFPVPLENGRIPGCIRCPHCGNRTCGE